jgi:ATP-dependent protease ClpP protease subunit
MTIPPVQGALIQQPRPAAFISFSAEVVPHTIEALLATAANLVNQGFREIVLLLSTPGGSVMHGITAYNILRGLPISLTTHNVGNVDSIGTVIFLAGLHRYACPQTTFVLHGVAYSTKSAAQFFERTMEEKLEGLRADQQRISAIYQERAGIKAEQAEQFFLRGTTINATEAVERGIVHELREVQVPAGSPVIQLVFDRKGTV